MTTPDLAPCPFCGESDRMYQGSRDWPWLWFFGCGVCNAEGPHKPTEAAARTAWNTRANKATVDPPTDTVTISRKSIEHIHRYLLDVEKGGIAAGLHPDVFAEIEAALSAPPHPAPDDGWVRVTLDNPLPDDLQVGDQVRFAEGCPYCNGTGHFDYTLKIGGNSGLAGVTHYRRTKPAAKEG